MDETTLTVLALLLVVASACGVIWAIASARATNKEQLRRYERAKRSQFVNMADLWHGYRVPVDTAPPHEDPPLRIEFLTEPIPKALHWQHRLAGEEAQRGRKVATQCSSFYADHQCERYEGHRGPHSDGEGFGAVQWSSK